MLRPYFPEAFTDFNKPENVAAFESALELVRSQLGQKYPLVIGGKEIWEGETFNSINPSRPDEVVGTFIQATREQAAQAIEVANQAFQEWQHTPAEERARYLLNAAAEMRRRKHEFSAWLVFEVGKSWAEADGDTAEAIDFMEYYARQILRIADSSSLLTSYEPEQLQLRYIPMGVTAVIPPWNFANAIVAGMTSAPLAAGNTVVLKPSEDSPTIAYKICELFWRNHIPAGVLNFVVSNPGSIAGEVLVDHPLTRIIAFTGSKEVGIRIYEHAAKVHIGQKWLKRAILEMGGKDAVLVDETADLEQAAMGIVASAFGFQGQKCSAGSRAILVRSIYDEVAERTVQLARKLSVAAPDSGVRVDMGPVINQDAVEKIMSYIEIGRKNHTLLTGGNIIETQSNGYFIEPTIFGDVPGDATIAQEEIFGPVLTLIPAKDYDDALRIANSTDYGLTGSVYSQDRARLERARREFHVGNLYFNRKCTGALVGVHPFGGFNMSGTDSKAGGPDYLLLFTQAKSIAEKL